MLPYKYTTTYRKCSIKSLTESLALKVQFHLKFDYILSLFIQATIKSYSEKNTDESRRNGEDLMKSTIVALKECLDKAMQAHRHNAVNYIHTCCKENILNKDVIQRKNYTYAS